MQRMFADIAPNYDVCNSLMSMFLHHRWRRFAVRKLQLKPGMSAIDICCGTGDFMKPLREAVGAAGRVSGFDFCLPMLEKAKQKMPNTSLGLGDACRLPIRSEVVDAASVGWGIRNVPDIDGAHREIHRILKRGGRFVSLDMALPRNGLIRKISEFFSLKVLPKLGALFGKSEAYTYLPESTQRFLSREELKSSMERAGFVDVEYKDLLMGNICVHWGRKA